ncbi:MAG: hypothetical protein V1688_00210 [bacterium]
MKKINYKIKKTAVFIICAIVSLSIFTNAVYASIIKDAASEMSSIKETYQGSSTTEITLVEVISKVIQYALSFLGVIFLALLIYAGFIWMTAAGDQEAITKAKNILQSSVIGLIIILSSYAVTYFVLQNLTKAAGTYY